MAFGLETVKDDSVKVSASKVLNELMLNVCTSLQGYS